MLRPLSFVAVFASVLFAQQINAQEVDCGNGAYCPAGHVCLVGGTCGLPIDAPRGATRTSTGGFCEPGYVEHQYRPGACVPTSYQHCKTGMACPPGSNCTDDGQCEGLEANGPVCGSNRCITGRVCSSKSTCINPDLIQDCGTGISLCTKAAACQEPRGCVYVAPERTPQIKK